jgi:hypothetical protein
VLLAVGAGAWLRFPVAGYVYGSSVKVVLLLSAGAMAWLWCCCGSETQAFLWMAYVLLATHVLTSARLQGWCWASVPHLPGATLRLGSSGQQADVMDLSPAMGPALRGNAAAISWCSSCAAHALQVSSSAFM